MAKRGPIEVLSTYSRRTCGIRFQCVRCLRPTGLILLCNLFLCMTLAGGQRASAETVEWKCAIIVGSSNTNVPVTDLGSFNVKGRYKTDSPWYEGYTFSGDVIRARRLADKGLAKCLADAIAGGSGPPPTCTQRQFYGRSRGGNKIWSEVYGWNMNISNLKQTAIDTVCRDPRNVGSEVFIRLGGTNCPPRVLWRGHVCRAPRPLPVVADCRPGQLAGYPWCNCKPPMNVVRGVCLAAPQRPLPVLPDCRAGQRVGMQCTCKPPMNVVRGVCLASAPDCRPGQRVDTPCNCRVPMKTVGVLCQPDCRSGQPVATGTCYCRRPMRTDAAGVCRAA